MSTKNSHNHLIELLGREHTDELVSEFLLQLGAKWSDIEVIDKDFLIREKEFENIGISVQFEDVGRLKEIPFHDIGDGPYILKDITF